MKPQRTKTRGHMKRDKIARETSGFQFEMTAAELAVHCRVRHLHHVKRAKFYEDQAKATPTAVQTPPQAFLNQALSSYQQPDPRTQLQQHAQGHRAKAARLLFASKHVIRGHKYRFEIDALPSELELDQAE